MEDSNKVCTRCGIEKNISEFHKSAKIKSGLQPNCKSCRKIIDRDSYIRSSKRRKAIKDRSIEIKKYNSSLLYRYKKFCGCCFCDEKEPVSLDLHHKNPKEKDINVSDAVCYSIKTLKKEIRKCIVICANCHRKLHAGLL